MRVPDPPDVHTEDINFMTKTTVEKTGEVSYSQRRIHYPDHWDGG